MNWIVRIDWRADEWGFSQVEHRIVKLQEKSPDSSRRVHPETIRSRSLPSIQFIPLNGAMREMRTTPEMDRDA